MCVALCVCVLCLLCSERPHAGVKRWSSVGWCDSDIQIVSDLEALRLQCHGVIWALPARYGAADVFQPKGGRENVIRYAVHTIPQTRHKEASAPTCTFSL